MKRTAGVALTDTMPLSFMYRIKLVCCLASVLIILPAHTDASPYWLLAVHGRIDPDSN